MTTPSQQTDEPPLSNNSEDKFGTQTYLFLHIYKPVATCCLLFSSQLMCCMFLSFPALSNLDLKSKGPKPLGTESHRFRPRRSARSPPSPLGCPARHDALRLQVLAPPSDRGGGKGGATDLPRATSASDLGRTSDGPVKPGPPL